MARDFQTRDTQRFAGQDAGVEPVGGRAPGREEAPHGRLRPREDDTTATLEDMKAEEMSQHTPEGRPPTAETGRFNRKVFIVVAVVALSIVVAVLSYWGGPPALLISGIIVMAFALGALPVWTTGYLRKKEEADAERAIRTGLGETDETRE